MKKILIAVLILLFIFALVRISTSTYENMVRENKEKAMFVLQHGPAE